MQERHAAQPGDWDDSYDIVIIGSGAAGMTAGIIAARRGLKPLMVEKAPVWGGTTAISMGGIWVPANRLMARAGIHDTAEDALQFLAEAVPPGGLATSVERQAAFVENAARMMDELVDAGMQWDIDADLPDYDSELPHASIGRCLDSKVVNGRKLGAMLRTMRRSTLLPFAVQLADLPPMGKGRMSRMVQVVLRHYSRKLVGQEPLGAGESLAAQLMMILQRLKVPVQLETSLREVVMEAGKAAGVVVTSGGRDRRIRATSGVILCAGGFAHHEETRQRLHNLSGTMSSASPDDTGEVIRMAADIGALTELSDDAWWTSAFATPEGTPSPSHFERSVPFSLCVGSDGKRFTNESLDYYHFTRAMVDRGGEPVWLIFDARHRKRYPFQGLMPGATPKAMIASGFLKTASSMSELARICCIDPVHLLVTIERFNRFAETGIDKDFHRGESRYDRHWGDPAQQPNPNLGPVGEAPFYAVQIHVSDLGTKGGYVTNANAQVLDLKGQPIEGLYASGNVTAPVVGKSYPGPGITLGPAMTFAQLAVEHATAQFSKR
jgi:3-oxosteroid 1-dehydrogenase